MACTTHKYGKKFFTLTNESNDLDIPYERSDDKSICYPSDGKDKCKNIGEITDNYIKPEEGKKKCCCIIC